MNNRSGAHLKAVLTAIADMTPEPPPLSLPPSRKPTRRQPLLVAAGAFVAVLVVVGAGLLALRSSATDERDLAAAPGTQASGASTQPTVADTVPLAAVDVVVPEGLSNLVLDLPGTRIVDAYNIFDQSTGTPVGIHTTYSMTLSDDPDDALGRLVELRIQQPGVAFAPFDFLVPSADGTDTAVVAGRDVTVFAIPDEAIAEGTYDLGILRWTETPGYEAILIPWGLGPEAALALLDDGLKVVSDNEWDQLIASIEIDTGTAVFERDELAPLLPRVVIDLPGFEIVAGTEAEIGPAHWRGEWQFRIGETMGTITLDSEETTPSQILVNYDSPEQVTVDGIPGLLARHPNGYIIEWEQEVLIIVSIDGTGIDPLSMIQAIGHVSEADWRQLLP